MNNKTIAIISARGGSKGLLGKNIIPLGGKPLIAWSIDVAKKSKLIERVIVTTDDEKIASAAREYGAEVPFIRPVELAQDDTAPDPVLKHTLQFLEEKEGVKVFKHISPSSLFTNILRNASCVVGNSSTGIRETCYFGTPVVNVGSRQYGRERGENVINVPHNEDIIQEAIEKQITHGPYEPEFMYGDGTAGKRLTEICASHELPSVQKMIQY